PRRTAQCRGDGRELHLSRDLDPADRPTAGGCADDRPGAERRRGGATEAARRRSERKAFLVPRSHARRSGIRNQWRSPDREDGGNSLREPDEEGNVSSKRGFRAVVGAGGGLGGGEVLGGWGGGGGGGGEGENTEAGWRGGRWA